MPEQLNPAPTSSPLTTTPVAAPSGTSGPPDGRCPSCRAALHPTPGFVTWCPACEWNLAPSRSTPEPSGRLERLERRLSTAAGERQHAQLRGVPLERLRDGRASVVALVIAGAVHLVTLTLLVAGLLVPALTWFNPFTLVMGLIALAAAWLFRPRLDRLPKDAVVITTAEAPVLLGLVDQVSTSVGGPRIERVVLDADFNAAMGRIGLRQEPIMWIGVPMWTALERQEKVALLGHELGHAVNGDARRGLLVHSAMLALVEWHRMLSPDEQEQLHSSTFFGAMIARIVLAPLRGAIRAVILLESKLLSHSGQRAEYLADALGARAAGATAAAALHDRFLAGQSVLVALRRAAVRRDPTDLRDLVRAQVHRIPALEWERLRRVAAAEGHQVDASHPPTALRRDLVLSRSHEEPTVVLTARDEAAIDRELSPYVPALQREIYDALTYAH